MSSEGEMRARVGEEEWAARVELAALYRAVNRYGLVDQIYNHITLKVPGKEENFLINPYGMSYEEITASSLMKISADGEILLQPDHDYGINYTGFVIHGAIHAARADIRCVAHTHTRAGIAVSAMACGLLPLSQSALRFHGNMGYHDYQGVADDLEERESLVADLGANDNLILRNHGLLSCGRTVAQTWINLIQLEMSCRAQVDMLASGTELTAMPAGVADAVQASFGRLRSSAKDGTAEWAAQLRWLDRNQPDYAS